MKTTIASVKMFVYCYELYSMLIPVHTWTECSKISEIATHKLTWFFLFRNETFLWCGRKVKMPEKRREWEMEEEIAINQTKHSSNDKEESTFHLEWQFDSPDLFISSLTFRASYLLLGLVGTSGSVGIFYKLQREFSSSAMSLLLIFMYLNFQ